jgi:CHAT domain-containing protein
LRQWDVTREQWRITGLTVFEQLLNAQPTVLQKRNLETKFSDFSRITVDSLIAQGEINPALQAAERYRNRCLTWILDEWKEQVISPSYAEMRQLLNPQTAIVYWHFSDDALTTFILTPDSEDPILLNALQYDLAQKLKSWLKTWNTQYNDYRTKKANQSDHPWRTSLATQLDLCQWLKTPLPMALDDSGAQEYLRGCNRGIEGKIESTEPPYRDPYYWAAFTHTGL